MVAYYSNYRLITNMLNAVVGCLGNSTMPAFGNIIHTDSSHVKRTFSRLMLLQHYLYSITCVCFVVVGTDFVTFMFGSDSGLPISVVALIAAVYYIRGFSYAIESLRGAYGAYEKDQYWSLFGALVNIVISIVGVLNIGLNGVLVGTVFAYTLKYIILIPRIVFNSCMNDNRKWYYERLVKYILITIFESILALLICRYINLNNVYVNFLLKGLTSAIVSFACTSIIFVNSDEQRELLKTGKRLLSRM
jgi:O-antigen/teichoic acid export membrane protein